MELVGRVSLRAVYYSAVLVYRVSGWHRLFLAMNRPIPFRRSNVLKLLQARVVGDERL